jgi:type I restriction enzyme, S subunit
MGSAVVALSRRDFLSYPVPPVTPRRTLLVALLDSIEERIELNRRMRETLESMARALFKSWFVDFAPVRAKAQGADTRLPHALSDLFSDRLVTS